MSNPIPDGWSSSELGEYVDDSVAGEWGGEALGDANDIPVLRSTNFTGSGRIDYTKLVFRNIEEKKRIKKSLKFGDIILEKSGGSPSQPVGRVVYFDKNEPYLFSNFTQKLSPSIECDSKFFFYKLYSEYQNGTVLKFQQQTTGIINFQLAEFLGFKTVFPPRLEQQKISTILSAVDDVIEKTRAQLDKLKDLKAGMMQELLTRGIGHTEFKDSAVGLIPVGWDVLSLGDICKVQGGYAFKSADATESGSRWLKIANVGKGEVVWGDQSFLPDDFVNRYSDFVLCNDDIVLALTRPVISGVLKVAKTTGADVPSLLNQRVARVIPNREKVSNDYLFTLFSWKKLASDVEDEIFGTDPPNVSTKQIESLKYAIPNRPEQDLIAASVSSVSSQISLVIKKLMQLEKAKKALMQDLLTGTVRVKIDDKESAVA